MENRNLLYCDLGLIDFKEAWDLQKEVFELRYYNEIGDILFLLEHPNTYTLGKIADKKNLISSEKFLTDNQISVYEIDRGGDITYHGPGQIVGYPIIKLDDWVKDTHKYLRALEEVIIKTCEYYGLKASRNPRHTGVWIENSKIAAIGIKVSRWITMHGFAFNINTNLSLFQGIIPCGISDKGVTSLKIQLGFEINLEEVKEILVKNFSKIFDYNHLTIINKDSFLKRKILTNI